jgi:hypothetical protein
MFHANDDLQPKQLATCELSSRTAADAALSILRSSSSAIEWRLYDALTAAACLQEGPRLCLWLRNRARRMHLLRQTVRYLLATMQMADVDDNELHDLTLHIGHTGKL